MLRYLIALLVFAAAIIGGILVYQRLTAGPAVVLPAPHQLEVRGNGEPLLPGGWTNSPSLVLGIRPAHGLVTGADVEVASTGYKFTDTPTVVTAPVVAGGNHQRSSVVPGEVAVSVHLADGSYRWQARLHNKQGISPWVVYPGVIRVDTVPPTLPAIASPTDPTPGKTYHSSVLRFDWNGFDRGSGVAGYWYRFDANPQTQAKPELRTPQTTVTLNGIDTGTWYFHVRVLDRAGNWGPTATFPVKIDVTPPGLEHVRFSQFHFDPLFNPLSVSFAVTRAARSIHVGIYRQDTNKLVRFYQLGKTAQGRQTSVTWDGKDAQGNTVPEGEYAVYIRATDQYGHSTLASWRDFVVDYRRIVVSLSQQRLWAYDGDHLVLTSLVTTGNKALPTPTGTFQVQAMFHPFTFISPWPKSSPYYYAPSPVSYALLFREGGYFIHDAPWRTAYGPGTNAQLGIPGTNYTGTHGCVNVPFAIAQQLYNWAEVGTVVQVKP